MIAGARLSGGHLTDNFPVPGVEAQHAVDLLHQRFPQQSGQTAKIVFHARHGSLADSDNARAIEDTVAAASRLAHVEAVADPFTTGALSVDGTTAFAQVRYDSSVQSMTPSLFDALKRVGAVGRAEGVQVEFGGVAPSAEKAVTEAAEVIGVAAALAILLVAFGSLISAGMPIALALFGLLGGLSIVTIVASIVDVAYVAPVLATMIGLGVGIDYALFLITRYRRYLSEGMTVEEAAGRACATSGQAIVFAGATVVIAISGLALVGIPFVASMGYASAVLVAVMVLASISLLPALLGFAGLRISRSSFPWRRRQAQLGDDNEAPNGVWTRWGNHVSRHPWRYLLASSAVLITMARPTPATT
jgi:RND superfamily putative drug exporter